MAHISDFKQVTLADPTLGPRATGTVRPDGHVDWIHIWVLQSQGTALATAVGSWLVGFDGPEWSVQTQVQPGSAAFVKGSAFALATASMTTEATDGTSNTTILHWTQTISIE